MGGWVGLPGAVLGCWGGPPLPFSPFSPLAHFDSNTKTLAHHTVGSAVVEGILLSSAQDVSDQFRNLLGVDRYTFNQLHEYSSFIEAARECFCCVHVRARSILVQ